ncbi:MAG: PQQ-dependent sugar dehydrogenase, partial [Phycisphaerales bacterium]|nr:PQQ-dependent sugar dehydrogenase [Phycisphaerales bacterium]
MTRAMILGVLAGGALATTTSVLGGAITLDSNRVATGMERPILVTHAPGDYGRIFVVEKRGHIEILDATNNYAHIGQFLDIDFRVGGGDTSFSEQGLLGMAFHPNYASNGKFYLNYTNTAGNTVVAEYMVSAGDPNVADITETKILQVAQPFTNHNCGWLEFGPDGYLYIGMGDGGSGGDPGNRAQDLSNQLLGKLLRIDVDGSGSGPFLAYGIPADNPFVGTGNSEEIWAYGLRNPWRNCFDKLTGDLYIADVGQNAWEEVNVTPASSTGGENYGWRCYEGNATYNTSGCAPAATMEFPVHVYNHSTGFSITGGRVYRGCLMPELDGTYFFADYGTARIWSFEWNGAAMTNFTERTAELVPPSGQGTIANITSFGEDAYGEIFICDQGSAATNGEIFKIVPAGAATGSCCPADADGDGDSDFDDLNIILSN